MSKVIGVHVNCPKGGKMETFKLCGAIWETFSEQLRVFKGVSVYEARKFVHFIVLKAVQIHQNILRLFHSTGYGD